MSEIVAVAVMCKVFAVQTCFEVISIAVSVILPQACSQAEE